MDTRSKMTQNIPSAVAAQRKIVIPPAPSPISSIDYMRAQRNLFISNIEWMKIRHADQIAMGQSTTLTNDQYTQLLAYIQALRNIPQTYPTGMSIIWPTPPSFIPASLTTLSS